MSIIARTSLVPEVLGSGAAVAPTPEATGDAFRGMFLPLVENGYAKTPAYINDNYAAGTLTHGVDYLSDPELVPAAVGAGKYGEDCLKIQFSNWAITFDHDNDRINAPGHSFVNGERVVLTKYDQDDDTLPAGLETYGSSAYVGTFYYVIDSVPGETFRISLTNGGAAVTFSDNGTAVSGSFGALRGVTGTNQHASPWLWIAVMQSTAPAQYANFTQSGVGKFLGPRDAGPYNRFEFLMKCPADYRSGFAAKLDAGIARYPWHRNWDIGTYNASVASATEENDNYHFYLSPWIRHDLKNAEWITVKLNERPGHQRSVSSTVPHNPVPTLHNDGSYWSTLTRLYLAHIQYNYYVQCYGGDLEVLIDRVRIFYEEPPYDITASWDSHDPVNFVVCDINGSEVEVGFTVTNNESFPIDGRLVQSTQSSYGAQLRDSSHTPISSPYNLTLPASGSWSGYLRFLPTTVLRSNVQGVVFCPDDQLNDDANAATGAQNFSDTAVERRWEATSGPHDAHNWSVTTLVTGVKTATPDHTNNTINRVSHGYANGNAVYIWKLNVSDTLPNGLSTYPQVYRVVQATADSFKVSLTIGGAEVDFSDNGTLTGGLLGFGS